MPSLANHHAKSVTKLLLVGSSGSGKTSALASLARAGYKLRILDFDNGTDVLAHLLKNEPEALERVVYEPLTDKVTYVSGTASFGTVTKLAAARAMALLTHWKLPDQKDSSTGAVITPGYDLGKPSEWGSDTVLVIDSLTMLGTAIKRYTDEMISAKDGRMKIYNAQQKLEEIISLLYSDAVQCNVIVLAHIKELTNDEGVVEDKVPETAIGNALSRRIGGYFNNVAQVEATMKGGKEVRLIHTRTRDQLLLKNSAPNTTAATYPHETGLAEFFAALRGEPKPSYIKTGA